MEKFSIEEFQPVLLENGELLYSEDGKVCLQHKTNGNIYFADQQLLNIINNNNTDREEAGPSSSTESMCQLKKGNKCKWTRDAIIALINERINMDTNFKSTTSKSEVKWKELANKLKQQYGFNMTPTQCNDKWRYLKAKYSQKIDNLGDKGTGEPPIDFEYFPLLDDFLRKKHQITPIAMASSTRGNTVPNNTENVLSDNEEEVKEPDKKIRKIVSKVSKIKEKKMYVILS